MSADTAHTLSAQEQAIESVKKVVHGTVTDRVLRMYEAIRAYGPPRVTLDRAVLFTESFKETENQPLVLRWARALKHFAEKAPVAIFPDELIVGRHNTWLGRWGIVYPELDGNVMPSGCNPSNRIGTTLRRATAPTIPHIIYSWEFSMPRF